MKTQLKSGTVVKEITQCYSSLNSTDVDVNGVDIRTHENCINSEAVEADDEDPVYRVVLRDGDRVSIKNKTMTMAGVIEDGCLVAQFEGAFRTLNYHTRIPGVEDPYDGKCTPMGGYTLGDDVVFTPVGEVEASSGVFTSMAEYIAHRARLASKKERRTRSIQAAIKSGKNPLPQLRKKFPTSMWEFDGTVVKEITKAGFGDEGSSRGDTIVHEYDGHGVYSHYPW
jgi:hypothetical protein